MKNKIKIVIRDIESSKTLLSRAAVTTDQWADI